MPRRTRWGHGTPTTPCRPTLRRRRRPGPTRPGHVTGACYCAAGIPQRGARHADRPRASSTVFLPNGRSRATLKGEKDARGKGKDRKITTAVLQSDKEYQYWVTATFQQNGEKVTQYRKVILGAGEYNVADFTRPRRTVLLPAGPGAPQDPRCLTSKGPAVIHQWICGRCPAPARPASSYGAAPAPNAWSCTAAGPGEPDQNGAGDIDRTIGAHDDARYQAEGHAVDGGAAHHVQDHRHEPGRETGQDRARQGLIHGVVDEVPGDSPGAALDFADAIEDHNRVVDRVADQGQEGRDDRQVDLEGLQPQARPAPLPASQWLRASSPSTTSTSCTRATTVARPNSTFWKRIQRYAAMATMLTTMATSAACCVEPMMSPPKFSI